MANYQVTFNQIVGTKPIVNVFYMTTTGGTPDGQAFADDFRAALVAYSCDDNQSNAWSATGLSLRQMDGGGAFSLDYPFTSGALVGADASGALPAGSCLLVSLQSENARPNRGRVYVGGLSENALSGGLFPVGARTPWRDLFNDYANGRVVSGVEWSLRIARPDFIGNTWTLDNPVDVVAARQNPASQRRRRLGAD